jgi:hypothetical protein
MTNGKIGTIFPDSNQLEVIRRKRKWHLKKNLKE